MIENFSELDSKLYIDGFIDSIFHMHASRQGPIVSNEIFLAIKEKEKNPRLETINGLLQPNGSVAKFLHYWLSGLDTQTSEEILSKIRLDGTNLFANGLFERRLLNANAGEVFGDRSELADAFVLPLFSINNRALSKFGFGLEDLEEVKRVKRDSKISFEDAMIDIPLLAINMILRKHHLPEYKSIRFNLEKIDDLEFKFVRRNEILKEYKSLMEKKERQYESAYNTIAKILKSYGGKFPNEKQLEWVLGRSWRIDPSFKQLHIDSQEIRYRFENPGLKHKSIPNYWDQIDISLLAHKRSIENTPEGNDSDIYIDGENMIKAMFNIANKEEYVLALQEFIRGTNYDLYKRLLNIYPNLKVTKSSFRIWDTEQFPEFDQNFVKGLKYLNENQSE